MVYYLYPPIHSKTAPFNAMTHSLLFYALSVCIKPIYQWTYAEAKSSHITETSSIYRQLIAQAFYIVRFLGDNIEKHLYCLGDDISMISTTYNKADSKLMFYIYKAVFFSCWMSG